MREHKNIRLVSSIFFVMSVTFSSTDAMATPQIQTQALALKVIPAMPAAYNCMGCHTVGSATADKVNLKPGYQSAYNLDKAKLTKLKAQLNILPTTTVGLASSGAAKTDIYQVYCVTGATSLSSSVIDLAPVKTAQVTTQVTKGTAVSPVRADAVDGDAVYSPVATLAGGVGPYSVKVNKTVSTQIGAESYAGKLACAPAGLGLAWVQTLNQ